MLRTKTNLRNYLEVIRPWAMGVDNRGWRREDFQTQALAPMIDGELAVIDREDVKEYRTDLAHVIFPLRYYEVTVLDRLFLSQNLLGGIMWLNQKIAAFNAVLDAVNATEDKELRWQRMILLHVGTIGSVLGPGIHEAFRQLDSLLATEEN